VLCFDPVRKLAARIFGFKAERIFPEGEE